jgi:hypothetical protein
MMEDEVDQRKSVTLRDLSLFQRSWKGVSPSAAATAGVVSQNRTQAQSDEHRPMRRRRQQMRIGS